MNKQRSILSLLVLTLGVLAQISKGTDVPAGYTALTSTQIASSAVQSMLTFGANQIVQLGYTKGIVPQSSYSVTTVNTVFMETTSTGTVYQCNVTIGDGEGVTIKATFTVFVSSSTKAMTLESWSYSVSESYVTLTATQIASTAVQAMLNFGAKQIVQLGESKNIIPVSEYSITTVTKVTMEEQAKGTVYVCNVTLGDGEGVAVKANFTVFVNSSSQAMTLETWSYSVSESYVTLNATQIASADVQAMLTFGASQIVQLGESKNIIPVSKYSLTTVTKVTMEKQSAGTVYVCNVTLGDANGDVVKTNFTVFVSSSTQVMTLEQWSYTVSKTTTSTGTTGTGNNTTNTTGTSNTTTTSNTTGTTGSTNTTGSSQLPEALIANMSSRTTRYHHYLWHQMRDNWNRFSDTQKSTFTSLGWAPPRPALGYYANGSSYVLTENGSGEDFLYMHRNMIAQAKELAGSDTSAVSAWTTVPAPGDATYPVPANYTIPNDNATTESTTNQKTDAYYNRNILPWENTFTDAAELKKMTLAELGSRMEFSIHNTLHMRFSAASSYGYRGGYTGIVPYINTEWDDSAYNWMGDLYASQVHPYFWKLHGWVDARIDDWMAANGVTELVWNNTWTGGPMSSLSSVVNVSESTRLLRGSTRSLQSDSMGGMDMSGSIDVLDQVMEALIATGHNSNLDTQPYMEDFVPEKHKYKGH